MFEARILEPGIVSYEDVGQGVAFLPRETIAKCANSFVGKPLILVTNKKGEGVHKKITPAQLEKEARGYITSVYEGVDGWFWARGVVFDDEAKDAINAKKLCSCGYNVAAVGPGGEYHAIRYHERIDSFSGEHLAIVDRPRYEGATIRLNSKAKTNTHMSLFKWFKKPASVEAPAGAAPAVTAAPAAVVPPADKNNAVAQPEDISASTEFEIPTGVEGKTVKVSLGTLIEAHNARDNGVDENAEVEVDGQPVALKDLVAGYKANAKASAAPAPAPATAAPAAAPVAPAPADKNNAKPSHFRVLLNARNTGTAATPTGGTPDSLEDRLARGNSKYGSKPAAEVAGKN